MARLIKVELIKGISYIAANRIIAVDDRAVIGDGEHLQNDGYLHYCAQRTKSYIYFDNGMGEPERLECYETAAAVVAKANRGGSKDIE